jgi:hypothetical protein
MWDCKYQLINNGGTEWYSPQRDRVAVRYREAVQLWQDDEGFRAFFISLLANSKFSAYRWETPAITDATGDRDLEFVLLDSPELVRAPDELAFADQFRSASVDERVLTFPNLGNDAVIVVPRGVVAKEAYVHLGAFARRAPGEQVHELWRAVGKAMAERLGEKPVWLSTAGMGVAWLHVRLDSRPKYYGFAGYRRVG